MIFAQILSRMLMMKEFWIHRDAWFYLAVILISFLKLSLKRENGFYIMNIEGIGNKW
jgi:hypothetical protein